MQQPSGAGPRGRQRVRDGPGLLPVDAGPGRGTARCLRLHLRQPARDAAARARRRAPPERRAEERGLVRLQGQRGRAARGRRRGARPRARPRLRPGGHRDDRRRLRRDRARLPPGDGPRRRGDHPGARLVLLRADAAHGRPRAGQGAARRPSASTSTSRRSTRRSRRAPAWWWSTRRTTRPAASTAGPSSRRSPTCSRPPRGASAPASGCSPTSPTAASASTAPASPARPRSIPGR